MAIWDGLFGKKDPAAEVKKLAGRVTQKFGPPENRQEAMERLVSLGTPEALEALTSRFGVKVDPSITDEDEKRFVCDALVEAGETAVPVLKRWVERSEQPTWALQALDRMVPAAHAADYARELPDSRTVVLPGLGHVPMEEDPPRALAPVQAFLGN